MRNLCTQGREHYAKAMVGLFAGAGVQGGRAMGATDAEAAKVVDFGWRRKRPIYPEDVCATINSVLGIDYGKRITNTPSGRDFVYVDPVAPSNVIGQAAPKGEKCTLRHLAAHLAGGNSAHYTRG